MNDFPRRNQGPSVLTVIPTHHPLAVQGDLGLGSSGSTWPTANKAVFVPFRIAEPLLVTKLFAWNGATASGNLDIGIYDENGVRLVSTGSTPQSGTNALQVIDVTDTWIGPGRFYLALALDGTSGTIVRNNLGSAIYAQMHGLAEMTSAFPLPATATLASTSITLLHAFGLVGEGAVV